ncbi:MAG: hypothetical protein NXH87_18190 [Rhodobiaceae bacterium]|nr:hypothetical protein [Rhodobiaceae bacterium]
MFQQSAPSKQSSFMSQGRGRSTALILIELAGACAFFASLYAVSTFISVATGNL